MGNTEFRADINVTNGVLWKRPSCNVLIKKKTKLKILAGILLSEQTAEACLYKM